MSDYESLRADAETEMRDRDEESLLQDAECPHERHEECDCVETYIEEREYQETIRWEWANSRGV